MAIHRSAAIAVSAVLAAGVGVALAGSASAATTTTTTTQAAAPAAAPAGKLIDLPSPGVVFTTSQPHTWSSTTVHLAWQSDGNLVLSCNSNTSHPNMALWASNTSGNTNQQIDFGGGGSTPFGVGSIDIYFNDVFGPVVTWEAGVTEPGDYAYVQNDGNFVVYSSSGQPLWATGTENQC
jgi:hypothetical protein